MYSDGSREGDTTGAGWSGKTWGGGSVEGSAWVGDRATVWDGEIRGVLGALRGARQERSILILADSQAAISAIRKASRTGTARTVDLASVLEEWKARETDGRTTSIG